ncbi:WXG100 family type VII secretion target [Paenibacillus sp. ALJ109b]|nr:WXG100 family type VII secretion target [Paenibacillus sp. ALJ109b]
MQRIQVHPDVLEEKARLVQQKKQELERMVRELEKSIYFLQSDWSGVTGNVSFGILCRWRKCSRPHSGCWTTYRMNLRLLQKISGQRMALVRLLCISQKN